MTVLAKLLALGAVVYLIKIFLYPFYKPVSNKQKKRARQYINERKKELTKQVINEKKKEFINLYGKYIISQAKRQQIQKNLNRLNMDISPEEVRLQQILYTLAVIVATIVLFSVNPMFGYIAAIFIIFAWLIPVDELEKKVEKKNKNIAKDFPAFYSMVYYQYSKTINIYLADVIMDFMPNANPDMAEELGVMLDNIEYGEEYALKQLKKRVPMHYIIKFCDIMETRLRGYDNTSQMGYLKNEIDEFRVRALERELEKRQSSNEKLQLTLIVILLIYIVIYYLFSTLAALKMFQ